MSTDCHSSQEQDEPGANVFFHAKDLYLEQPFVDPPSLTIKKQPDTTSFRPELTSLLSSLSGDGVLVLLPTENEDKAEVLKGVVPSGFDARFEVVKSKSDVGEQPYNRAGIQGAMNRIKNALEIFVTDSSPLGSAQAFCQLHNIGRILVMAIENYITGTDISYEGDLNPDLLDLIPVDDSDAIVSEKGWTLDSPVDFGFACLYDTSRDMVFTAHSRGVRIPFVKTESGDIDFVAYAKSKGYIDGNRNHGAQTVGKAIKALVRPAQGRNYSISANWHGDVTGWIVTRYDLLKEAVAKVQDEAIKAGVFQANQTA